MGRKFFIAVSWLAVVLLAGCSGDASLAPRREAAPGPASVGDPTTIGPAGGIVRHAMPNGEITVDVPASALAEPLPISVAARAAAPAGAIGPIVELGPSGTRFAAPVKVTFRFAPGAFPVVTGAPVYVATYVNRAWERLSVAPSGSDAVAGYTTHFSLFGVVADEPFQPEYLLESSGTDFALAGVSLSSSVRLEMLSMMVAATRVDYIIEAHGAADAEIQLRGLRPSTTLSIFDNAYAHKTLVVTDELGTATYRQALGGGRHEVRGRRRRRRLRVDRNLRR